MAKIKNPKEICLAVTYRCNARCQGCSIWQHPTDPQKEIQPEHLESLPRFDFCNLSGGEPFLREDLEELVRLLLRKVRRLVISTNGYLTEEIIDLAKKFPGAGFRISLEGLPAAHDELRGLKDGFDHALRTLLELGRLNLKDIGVAMTLSDRNILDLIDLFDLSKEKSWEFATAIVHNNYFFHKFDNQITKISDFERELKKLIIFLLKSRRVKNWFRAYFNYGILNHLRSRPRLLPCVAGERTFFVDPYGEIYPCNGQKLSLGNLKEKAFPQIWFSEEARKVWQKITNCGKNCWMVGSVAPSMKKFLGRTAWWALKNKLRVTLGQEFG
jgi:MoaA/NifB/PqqE/SkfB family radical SAM enzyme